METRGRKRKIEEAQIYFSKIHKMFRDKVHIDYIEKYNHEEGEYPYPARWRKCKDANTGVVYWTPIHLYSDHWKYTDVKANRWCLTYEPHWNPVGPIFPHRQVPNQPTGKLDF